MTVPSDLIISSRTASGRWVDSRPVYCAERRATIKRTAGKARRRFGWLVAAFAVVAAIASPPAAADWTTGPTRAADAQLLAEVDLAVEFWAARGVTGCPNGIVARFAKKITDGTGQHADGLGGQCELFISESLARIVRARGARWWRRSGLREECTTVVHEVKHALPGGTEGGVDGLGHTDGGVMDGSLFVETPWECTRWARRTVRETDRRPHVRVASGALS